jgi:hypothetical protein
MEDIAAVRRSAFLRGHDARGTLPFKPFPPVSQKLVTLRGRQPPIPCPPPFAIALAVTLALLGRHLPKPRLLPFMRAFALRRRHSSATALDDLAAPLNVMVRRARHLIVTPQKIAAANHTLPVHVTVPGRKFRDGFHARST